MLEGGGGDERGRRREGWREVEEEEREMKGEVREGEVRARWRKDEEEK